MSVKGAEKRPKPTIKYTREELIALNIDCDTPPREMNYIEGITVKFDAARHESNQEKSKARNSYIPPQKRKNSNKI